METFHPFIVKLAASQPGLQCLYYAETQLRVGKSTEAVPVSCYYVGLKSLTVDADVVRYFAGPVGTRHYR